MRIGKLAFLLALAPIAAQAAPTYALPGEAVWLGQVSPGSILLAVRAAATGPVSLYSLDPDGPPTLLSRLPDGITNVTAACRLPSGDLWLGTDKGLVVQSGAGWTLAGDHATGGHVLFVSVFVHRESVPLELRHVTSIVPYSPRAGRGEWAYVGADGLETPDSYWAKVRAHATAGLRDGGVFSLGWAPDERLLMGGEARYCGTSGSAFVFATPHDGIAAVGQGFTVLEHLGEFQSRYWSGTSVSASQMTVTSAAGIIPADEWFHPGEYPDLEGAFLGPDGICALYARETEAGLLVLGNMTWVTHPLPPQLLGAVPEFVSWAWDGRRTIYVGTARHGLLAFDDKGWRKVPISDLDGPVYIAWAPKPSGLWIAAGRRLVLLR